MATKTQKVVKDKKAEDFIAVVNDFIKYKGKTEKMGQNNAVEYSYTENIAIISVELYGISKIKEIFEYIKEAEIVDIKEIYGKLKIKPRTIVKLKKVKNA